MDKIILKDIVLFGYHGVLQEEKKIGQRFELDIKLYLDLKDAGKNDDLNETVNYAEIYEIAKKINENNKFDLIEAFAEKICEVIIDTYISVSSIKVVVRKPAAPVAGIFAYAAVEIKRCRDEI